MKQPTGSIYWCSYLLFAVESAYCLYFHIVSSVANLLAQFFFFLFLSFLSASSRQVVSGGEDEDEEEEEKKKRNR